MKKVEDLAIFNQKPAFREILHVGRPNIGNREKLLSMFNSVLDRNWLTNNGPFVHEFEQRVADLLGVKHCICMCNGTVALEIAVRALGLNHEVIIPSFTFIATAHSLQWQAITPVFCDIDPETFNIDPEKIERLITSRTTGIIGVHLWGRPCEIEKIKTIADKHNLKLLFDASHSLGVSYKEKMIGGFGNAETFSFHATKFLNSFEGGAVTTNDDELAGKIRLMKNFGFSGLDNVIHIGTNGKMSEVSAVMGLTSLEDMEEFILMNYRNYKAYISNLADIPGIKMMLYDENSKNNFHYIILEIDRKKTGISRDNLMHVLHEENVRARRYFYPGCHRMEPYCSYYPNAKLLLPKTEKISERVLSLPTGTAIGSDDIEKICEIIRFVVDNGFEIQQKLSGMDNEENKSNRFHNNI